MNFCWFWPSKRMLDRIVLTFQIFLTHLWNERLLQIWFLKIYICVFLWDFTSRFKLYKRIKIFFETLQFKISVFIFFKLFVWSPRLPCLLPKYNQEKNTNEEKLSKMENCVQLFLWYFSCRSRFPSYIEILRQANGLNNLTQHQ